MIQILPWATSTSLITNSSFTYYWNVLAGCSVSGSAAAGNLESIVAAPGTFRNLVVALTTAPGSGKSYTLTIQRNDGGGWVDTGLTVTIADAATSASVTGVDEAFAAGDRIRMKQTSVGTPTDSGFWRGSLEFESDETGVSIYGGNLGWQTGGGTTRYEGVFRIAGQDAAASSTGVRNVAAAAGTITALYAFTDAATIGATYGVTLYINKNGTRQDGTGGTVDTALNLLNKASGVYSTTFSLSVAAGDVLYLESVAGADGGWFIFRDVGVKFVATTDGQSQMAAQFASCDNSRTNTDYWPVPCHLSTTNGGATESNLHISCVPGPTGFALRDPQFLLNVAPGSGDSATYTLRKNGADTGLIVTVSGTATTGSTTGSVSFVDGDTFSMQRIGSGTPDGGAFTWTYIQGPGADGPDPGGEVPPGTNPPQGTQPGANPPQGIQATTFPLIFLEIKNGSTTTAYAETALADRAEWYNGYKAARILKVSPIRRALSRDGGFEVSTCSVELADTDRSFREAARTSTLTGQYCSLYVVDDATRRAEGVPYRIFAGMIASHRALPGFRYELQIEDVLGTRFADVFREPIIPSFILTSTDFPVMDPTRDGGTAPVALGELSDADASTPQGIVPAIYLGYSNLRTLSNNSAATNTLVAAFIFCQNACASIPGIYYNPPTSPSLRFLAPSTAAGSLFWAPHWPSWSQTGYTANYADWPNSTSGYRFTPIFLPWGTDVASAAISGQMLISANLVGTENYGNAAGAAITAPERLIQHVLTNYVFTSYRTGSYAPVPFFPANSYTILDTSTVENAVYASTSRVPPNGYRAGLLLGADGAPQAAYDVIGQLLQGADLDMGVNRHGQIILSREAISATAVVSYTAQTDILEGSFEAWTATDEYANQLTTQWGYRYIAPSAPLPTPSVNNPLPVNPVASYNPFSSGVTKMFATSAASLVGRVVNANLDNYAVRINSFALNVGSTVIARALGPSNDGPHMVRFSTGWQGFGKNQVDVDLGSVITVDHPEGLSSTGYTAKRVRVLAMEVDPQAARVTLEGRVLP